jgi:signal transduction histidine kinase
MVGDSMRLLQSVATGKSVTLEARLSTELSAVLADRERIVQVLSNLINAQVRFVAKGGAVIVQAEPADAGVRVSVAGSGPPMAGSDLVHVFDRHWWASRTSGLGTGLALAVAKGIVEAHGGRIWVDSRSGPGNAFCFTIPAAEPHVGEAQKAAVHGWMA